MQFTKLSLALLLSAGLAVGCDQSSVDEATDAAQNAADGATDAAKDEAGGAMDAAKKAAEDTAKKVEEKSGELMENLSLDSLKEGMSLDGTQADGIIEKVKGMIEGGNLKDAGSWISKLESVKLPDGYAEKFQGLKDLYEKAKGAAGALNLGQ